MLCACCLTGSVFAQEDYPFDIPETITAELDVQTGSEETFLNPLLGYNIFGFESDRDKELIRKFDPITVRFPHGLFANWYDWRRDVTRLFGTETFEYVARDDPNDIRTATVDEIDAINTFDRLNRKLGIDGLEQLNRERILGVGKGFDMVWTFNMSWDAEAGASTDEAPETLAFYDNLIARGLEVKDVEMGNENFYPGQRSSFIPNAPDYVARAKAMGEALKSRDPDIKVSIPLLRRGSFFAPKWNDKLTEELDYFDAVTVHTYIGKDPDNADNNDDAYSTALTARKSLASSTNDFVRIHTTKPVWLTEWGVSSGGANAVSALGMADCIMFMAENQDIYQRANWFSVNGKLNSFVAFTERENGSKDQVKYPLEKTAYGLTHDILQSVLANSVLLDGNMTTLELESGVNAVTARAVTKDGKTTVLVLNLTDKSVPFTLKLDGTTYDQPFIHKAMQFSSVDETRELPIDQDPLSEIKSGMGAITLPPLSISTVFLGSDSDAQAPTVALTSPAAFSSYKPGDVIPLMATASDIDGAIVQVQFTVDSIDIDTAITTAPYETTFTPTEAGTYRVSATATDDEGTSTEAFVLIYVTNFVQEPFTGSPIRLPGVFEAEDFDKGGQDLAYNDKTPGNTGDSDYRAEEDVDISLSDERVVVTDNTFGEWTEFTVAVADSNSYNFEWTYATKRPNAGLTVELIGQGTIIERIDLPNTGEFTTYLTATADSVALPAGEYVLRFRTIDGGYNIDKITVTSNAEQSPYAGITQLPGKLEAENYDIGGTDVSFVDNDAGNTGGVYRTDDVDIGTGGTGFVTGFNAPGEWQEHTVNVTSADFYALDMAYASGRPGGGGMMSIILPDAGMDTIVNAYEFPVTEGWGSYDTITLDSVFLEAGEQVIRLFVAGRGYNLDFIEFRGSNVVSTSNFQKLDRITVSPNPSSDGRFFLEKEDNWTIYSLTGRTVAQGKGREIDLSNFARATYLLRTTTGIGKIIFQ